MQVPLQVTFEGSEPSEAVRALIDREVDRLEKHNHRIIGCRVAVIAPSDKHRHGTGFQVHILAYGSASRKHFRQPHAVGGCTARIC